VIIINTEFGVTRISGYVNNIEVVAINNAIFGEWHTATSCCLPSNFKLAKQYADVYAEVFKQASKIISKSS
jgi:hypothetical protein